MFCSPLSVKSTIAQTAEQIIDIQDARSRKRMQFFFVPNFLPQVAVEDVNVNMTSSCLASLFSASTSLPSSLANP